MRWLAIGAAALLGLVILLVALIFGASETGGEIVTLETLDADGQPHETRLWVVEHDGYQWLRAGKPDSGWLLRLEAAPEVTVTRAGEPRRYRAEPVRDPETRNRIHALMAERYGWAERLIANMRDGSLSVPVKLVPLNQAG